jgi:hypothetical protein
MKHEDNQDPQPTLFWADVVDIVVYLINKGPSIYLDGGILEEAWKG